MPAAPVAQQLLVELDRAVADLPGAGVAVAARRLDEAADAIDRDERGETAGEPADREFGHSARRDQR